MKTTLASLAGLTLALGTPAIAQVTVGAPVRMDSAAGFARSNETTQAASKADPLVAIGGWNDYRQAGSIRAGFAWTVDGGETWADFLLRPDAVHQANVEGDPMTAFDDRTGAVWAGAIAFAGNGGIYSARLDAGQAAFEPSVMINATGGADKGWMAAGPDFANPQIETRVFCAYNLGSQFSTDMGDTWSLPVPLDFGIGFLPRVGPNGELYIAYWDFDDEHRLLRSFDGGQSFGAPITIALRMDVWGTQESPRVAGGFRVPSLQGLAIDPNSGALYCVYADTTNFIGPNGNLDVYFTRSVDQGATWSTPVVINGDGNPFVGDQFFPWIEVDEDSRLHVLWYDTRNVFQNDDDDQAFIDAYYAYSEDQGATWSESRLSQPSFSSEFDGLNGGFMGDYLGMSVGGGRALPIYMATDAATSGDVYTNVITHGPATTYCRGILCPCGNDDPTAGCGNWGLDGNSATGGELGATGSPSIAADDLVLTLSGIGANQFGLFFTGQDRASVTLGDGHRCLGGQLFRYPVFQANGAGVATLGPGEVIAGSLNFGPAGQVLAGATWRYQGWYRDPMGPCGTTYNFSNAVSVRWE